MTMLEIFKSKLPQGVEITKVRDNRGHYGMTDIWLDYKGTTGFCRLHKICAPGEADYICSVDLCSAMMSIAIERKDNELFKNWMHRQQALIFAHHNNSPDGVY